MNDTILLRYGEVGVKSRRKRSFFDSKYVKAIEQALTRHGFEDAIIKNLGGRFIITHKHAKDMIFLLQSVPGIQSVSLATSISFETKDDLLFQAKDIAKEYLSKTKTFRVSVKREGKHNFSSMELASSLGEQTYSFAKGVSLHNPDITIFLEIRNKIAYLYTTVQDGLGGMPAATGGKVLCMFSGGLDSPVAAYQMLKRGAACDFVYFDLIGDDAFRNVATVYNYIISRYAYNYTPKLYYINALPIVQKITQDVVGSYRQLALKIAFYKMAEYLSKEYKYPAVVTGEALSQKSSQTIESLSLIASQSSVLVLRPLISFDKLEIIRIAESIGTFASSQCVKEYCNLSSGPVTARPHLSDINKIPNIDELVSEVCQNIHTYKGEIDIKPIPINTEDIDMTKAIIIDLRLEEEQKKKPVSAQMHIPFTQAKESLDTFSKEKSYIFLCKYGVLSAEIAYALAQKGIQTKSMRVDDFLAMKK